MISYHKMCRWNSGLFYKHPALKNTRYYWRVEPNVHFFCDVDYDVFRYMHDNNKTYGFTINLYDDPKTLPSLWPETVKFLADHPDYLHDDNAIKWVTDDTRRPPHNKAAHGFSTCHFWSNFEVADMEFWRSKTYEDYFNHLDRAGGFFYERWGDAPVHSIALGLFEDRSKIHWFVTTSFLCLTSAALTPMPLGSVISATNTSLSSTAPTRPNAEAASLAVSLTVKPSFTEKTAVRTGSSSLAWAKYPIGILSVTRHFTRMPHFNQLLQVYP